MTKKVKFIDVGIDFKIYLMHKSSELCLGVCMFVCLIRSQEPFEKFASNFDQENQWNITGMFLAGC